MDQPVLAPPWRISEWLNTNEGLDLETQRGRVVVACAFQMLCTGCVSHAIPQLKAVHDLFAPLGAVVVGLHTIFEHHEAITTTALRAFLLINRSGHLRRQIFGHMSDLQLGAGIMQLLSEPDNVDGA